MRLFLQKLSSLHSRLHNYFQIKRSRDKTRRQHPRARSSRTDKKQRDPKPQSVSNDIEENAFEFHKKEEN
ncbi:hypothetical protein ACS0TY_024629 [Phlomoides rotata]